ncbi:hypothetical protein AB0J21_07290 [Streptomyces sp. NPDC049954]|uniref:hypothetical protein n=1 Tax=Streptomyces sp. NPDC049954 TaxID=3155779 RepID=UPI00342DD8F6
MAQDADDAVDCGMTVGLYGRLRPYPWTGGEGGADDGGEELRERLVNLALSRAEAYDWYAPAGLRMRGGRSAHPVPDRWFLCDQGGADWTVGEDETGPARELLWMRADLPRRIASARLPLLPMTRTASDALHRAGDFRLAALRAHLPLHVTAGEADGDWEDMRDWFSLAAPAPTVTVRCAVAVSGEETTPPAWRSGGTAAEVGAVWQTLLGEAVTVAPGAPPATSAAGGGVRYRPYLEPARPVAAYRCRVREWTADAAVWLLETAGEALRRTGHRVPVELTAALA